MKKFELPESLKGSPDAEALEKVGQAIVDSITKANGEAIESTIAEKMKEVSAAGASKETVEALETALKAQGSAITELKERGASVTSDWRKEIKTALSDKSIIDRIKSGGSHEMVIKVDPATITTSGQMVGAPHNLSTTQVAGVSAPPREMLSLLAVLSKGSTNSETIRWISRSPANGAAAATAENALKPAVDFSFTEETSNAKKIASYMNISEEALNDEMYMQSVINDVLAEVTEKATNNELLNGDGTGAHLKGILVDAPTYAGTGLDGTVVNASTADAIYAAALQVKLAHLRPDTVLINPSDMATIDLEKNENGTRQGAEAKAILSALRFVETSDMPVGKIAVFDNTKIKVLPYKGYTIRWGYINDDFRRNARSVVAELRLHSYHEAIYDSCIVCDDIATITGALQKAAV